MRWMIVALLGLLALAPAPASGQEAAAAQEGTLTLHFNGLRGGDWFGIAERAQDLAPAELAPEEVPVHRRVRPGRVYHLVFGPPERRPESLRALPFYVPIPAPLPRDPVVLELQEGLSTFPPGYWRAALGPALPADEERKLREFAARFQPPPTPVPPEPDPEPVPPPEPTRPPEPPAEPVVAGDAALVQAALQNDLHRLREDLASTRQLSLWTSLTALGLSVAAFVILLLWIFTGWLPHRRALAQFEATLNKRLASQTQMTNDLTRQLEALRRQLETSSPPEPPART